MSDHRSDPAPDHGAPQRRSLRSNGNDALPLASAVDPRFAIQQSAAFRHTLELCHMYAPIRRPIVFVGPIGVGKSTLARLVHELSGRTGRFVSRSVGEIDDTLALSLLFGHIRGAFTGAIARQTGVFEAAMGGTLLLDDIANLSTHVQRCMLQVLEDRAFKPLGATRDIPVTCRELYATTQPLETLVEQGILVPDFQSRMGELVVEIPPLRQRPEDIRTLAEDYVVRVAEEFGWKPVTLTADVCHLLARYPWPHNVRELKGVIELAVIHARAERRSEITPDHVPIRFLHEVDQKKPPRRLTRALVYRTLRETAGNFSEAARRLGVHRNTLYRYVPAGARWRILSVDDPRL